MQINAVCYVQINNVILKEKAIGVVLPAGLPMPASIYYPCVTLDYIGRSAGEIFYDGAFWRIAQTTDFEYSNLTGSFCYPVA